MNAETFLADIPQDVARRAYDGVSMFSERRGDSTRAEYAACMAADFEELRQHAEIGRTLDLLPAEFARYREGYRRRLLAYLHSSARCVSWFVAGPSNFPAARMEKKANVAHRRLDEMIEFRARAMSAIKRTLRPDLRPIYASDGDAIEQLETKIAKAEALQAQMKAANAAIRKNHKAGEQAQIAALLALGFTERHARELLKPDFCGRIGFADYELTNNGANIRRMKQRIAVITELKATPASEIEGANARFEDAPQDNRVRLFFPGKPDEKIRDELKANGFRWTPSLGCWQAFRNYSSTVTAKRIAGITENKPAEASAA